MSSSEAFYNHSESEPLLIERLPDNSVVIYDQRSKDVHSLNASAATIWDSCADGATNSTIAAAVEQRFGAALEEDALSTTIEQLQKANLIRVQFAEPKPAGSAEPSRRAMLTRVGAVAIPVVLTLTAAEQRASADGAKSGSSGNKPSNDPQDK